MKIRHFIPALGLLALASCKTAAPATAAPDRFVQADANKDGKISRDEMSDYQVVTLFTARDANGDKKMTLEEWNPSKDAASTKSFKERDKNKDGVVTLEEAIIYARHKKSFDAIFIEADTNKDHSLSREEVVAYYASKEGSFR